MFIDKNEFYILNPSSLIQVLCPAGTFSKSNQNLCLLFESNQNNKTFEKCKITRLFPILEIIN